MKRAFLIFSAMLVIALTTIPAQAAGRGYRRGINTAPRSGPFSRLMELERRKNAAIRDMFRR
ncbi:hypothetical protein [Planctomicrobium sp. SH664]|uniref:hypothetical protein n=1 Tax=Planctomicrobium sp. SH664 TaxID=3448125 RepID=UPI003F5BBEBA